MHAYGIGVGEVEVAGQEAVLLRVGEDGFGGGVVVVVCVRGGHLGCAVVVCGDWVEVE